MEETGARKGCSTSGGRVALTQGELFSHDLAGTDNVLSPIELNPHDSQSDSGRGTDAPDPRRAVKGQSGTSRAAPFPWAPGRGLQREL
jgi:hypothetical protein